MAYVQLDHRWPDGEAIIITVGDDSNGYPDQLAELQARALGIHRELVIEVKPAP